MNTLLRRLLNYDTMGQMIDVAHQQSALIDRLLTANAWQQIETARGHRDLLASFLIALDKPEDEEDLRDTLHAALVDMSDEVARLEEHAPR